MTGRKVVKLSRIKVRESKEEREQEKDDAEAAEMILKWPGLANMMRASAELMIGNVQRQARKAEELRRKREMPHVVVEMKPKQ